MAKYSTVSMFVGFRGDSVWVGGGTEWPDDHPIVVAHPDWFVDTPPGGAAKPKTKRLRQPAPAVTASVEQKPRAGD